jgi:hypothetical protein
MTKTIVGLFDSMEEAHNVAQNLISGGFARADISLIGDSRTTPTARMLKGIFTDALVEALTRAGIHETDIRIYREEVAAGRALVMVRTTTYTIKRAAEIMAKHGIIDVKTRRPRLYNGNAGAIDTKLCYEIDNLPAVREARYFSLLECLTS